MSSGYMHVASMQARTSNAPVNVTGLKQWIGTPLQAGSAYGMEFNLYKRGTPPTAIFAELWVVASGKDPTSNVTTPAWTRIAVCSIDPSSVTGINSASNATWVYAPLDAPVYMDTMPQGIKQWSTEYDQQEGSLPYAITINPGSATTTSDCLIFTYSALFDDANGQRGNGTDNRGSSTSSNQDLPINIHGMICPSSKFIDSLMFFPVFIGSAGTSFNNLVPSSTYYRSGTAFTAVGCVCTRIKWNGATDGNIRLSGWMGIWTTNVSSDLPDTCVGTSHMVVCGSESGKVANCYIRDMGGNNVMYDFVFASGSGIAVNSGTKYWAIFECESHTYNSIQHWVASARQCANADSTKRIFADIRSPGIWVSCANWREDIAVYYRADPTSGQSLLTGKATIQTSLASDLGGTIAIAGQMTDQSSFSAAISNEAQLYGSFTDTSSFAANLAGTLGVLGQMTDTSSFAADLSITNVGGSGFGRRYPGTGARRIPELTRRRYPL